MKKTKFSHKVIAVFLTLNFLTTIVPVNHLFANNNGPGSPEAAGFEPVDATDMVNLSTGDLSYVLPLMSVEGFPVSLSYHAGMTADMDASWVGLGWYLTPGAINRSVTNTPDDWKGGVGINFNSYYAVQKYFGVSVEFGFPGTVSVGVGLNWGGGQGLSGSVSAAFGLDAATGGLLKGGGSASVSSTGDASVGVGYGINLGGKLNAGAGISYSLKNQWNLGVGIGHGIGDSGAFVGAGFSTGGGLGISGAGNNNTGKNGNEKSAGNSGGIGMGSSSFSSGDASIDTQSTGIALPLHVVGIPITLGFRKTKVKINIKKGFLNEEWGALYANDYNYLDNNASIYDVSNYNEEFSDYALRTRSTDAYSTRLPQSEEDFIANSSKDIENINFTFLGYDNYNVAAQGLMGNMTPYVFQNATIFGKGQRTKNDAGDNIHAFWHHGVSGNAVKRKLGRLSGTNQSYNNTDFYFYFNGQFTSIEKNNTPTITSGASSWANDLNDLITEGAHSGTSNDSGNSYYGRAKSPNFVEVFTNSQIADGHAGVRGLISPATVPNSDRTNTAKFDPNGIGAYKITSPDGKTYHFALPVYHYEQMHRNLIDTQENSTFDVANVNEKRQYSRYATHWLLTAITGSDYVDVNNNGEFDKTDYGYWVELEYGKWSDGFVWRSPYQDRVYEYNTNLEDNIESKDKGGYSFGRKQLYYLDKINTKNRTALFVKDIRYDAIGKDLKFRYYNGNNQKLIPTTNTSHILNYPHNDLYVRENTNNVGVSYKREYSLKLSKIVLVDGDVGKNLSKNATTSSDLDHQNLYAMYGYQANDDCFPDWESPDFKNIYGNNYSYTIHNESAVLDVNDVSSTFITQNALEVVELNHSYDLAKNSPSSLDAPSTSSSNPLIGNTNHGRLTLESVQKKGKGGSVYMPATTFNYYLRDYNNITFTPITNTSSTSIKTEVINRRNKIDAWGFLENTSYSSDNEIKAWSLKDITMPTGAKIEIDYKEDEYWTEAFSRRYWQDGLMFNLTQESGILYMTIKQDPNTISSLGTLYFTDYFNQNEKTFLDFFYFRNPSNSSCGNRIGDYSGAFEIVNLTNSEIKLKLPNPVNSTHRTGCDQFPWSYTAHLSSGGPCNNLLEDMTWVKKQGDQFCGWSGHDTKRFKYKLLANKVPEDETGGGLRVAELRTVDNGNIYKVDYDYNYPGENRSSGITSYAPVKGLKFVPYQSEIPAPGVMYEYVTMKETTNSGEYDAETRYRHHVLKPVYNIFNPNIEMEALEANAEGEDKIFWASVTEDYGGLNGTNSREVTAKKIEVNINSALIGQIKSIENLNDEGHIMLKTENEYINGIHLVGQEPNKGYTKETFNSMKSIFETNAEGNIIHDEKRLLSISSKTEYNNMLKRTKTYAGGYQSMVKYSDVDPWLSSFRKSETTMADGTKTQSVRIPAYEKYDDMQSKILDPTNKNMLTQEVMNITNVDVNGTWKTLNANITTWNDNWTYRDNSGTETTESGVWRKHKNFVWKDNVSATTGAYNTNITETSNYFNWGTGTPTNNKWQNVSEITRYSHWSSPVETKDINGNFAASKMADNFSKATASGNARYSEIYYCGAEHVASGNTFEGEVLGANYRQSANAHTGSYSVKTNSANNKVFEVTGNVGTNYSDTSKDFRPGKYKVSFWMYHPSKIASNQVGAALKLNSANQTLSETVEAGNWKQYNYYVNLAANASINLYVTNISAGGYYFDDFRMHPVYASMNSYVYDQDTDELTHILDANNMATKYVYDPAGRLCKIYAEAVNDGTFTGGFKLISKNEYYYKGVSNPDCGDCCDSPPLP